MSSSDRALAYLAQFTLASDGLVAGLALAFITVQTWRSYYCTSSALHKIRQAPSVRIADLRSVVESSADAGESECEDRTVVVVRGLVQAKSAVDGNWLNLKPNVLVSNSSDEAAVVLQRSQTCIYNEWRGLFGLNLDWRFVLGNSWKDKKLTSFRTVPFVLVDAAKPDCVVISLEGSKHPLPLITTYQHLQPIPASPYMFLQAFLGYAYPVGLLDEEKILPVGKEVTAVGICGYQDGIPHIKSCKDLPFFLSFMTKDQMVADLVSRKNVLFWSGIVLGSASICILGYAITRNWRRWKDWCSQIVFRRSRNTSATAAAAAAAIANITEDQAEEESGDVPDGQLCVICLARRRRSAFVPCGHRVCCHRCALSVERDTSPKCPVCRQTIRTSVIIYES